MTRQQIEQLLKRGFVVGFRTEVDDADFLGWILITKLGPNPRALEILDPSDGWVYERAKLHQSAPYLVLEIELRREVHDAGGYETEEDYRTKNKYRFSDLEGVSKQLESWGLRLEDAIVGDSLDAP